MLEGSKAAAAFIDHLIDAKLAGTEIEPEVRKNLHRNLTSRLESQITHNILALLEEHEQLELEHLVDSQQTDKIEEYLTNHGVNLNQVLGGVMAEFQASYLGA
jgi:hypothetical protein